MYAGSLNLVWLRLERWSSSEEQSIRELVIYTQNVNGGSAHTNGLAANLHASVDDDVAPGDRPAFDHPQKPRLLVRFWSPSTSVHSPRA